MNPRDSIPDRSAAPDPAGKIVTLEQLVELRDAARAAGRTVVQCHGCFDIVHPGHVRHLRQARALGDVLVVTITGDAGVSKGAGRPLIPQELRAENLAALDCVTWVCIDPSPTAADLLAKVRPDVYVKGKEYESNRDPRFEAERRTVEAAGGRVVFSSGDVVFSSTALIAAMETATDPFHQRLTDLASRPELAGPELMRQIAAFRGRRVVVVGEPIIDTYVFCDRPEVAGESPILTLRPVDRRRFDGGAAIIARHAAALGARPVLVTALPGTDEADGLRRRLSAEGVEVVAVPTESPLAEKQRFLVGSQKVMKLDLVPPVVLDAGGRDRLVAEACAAAAGGCDAAIIADFGLGLLGDDLVLRMCRALRPVARTLAGDVSGRRSGLRAMRGADVVCPTESELRAAYHEFDEGLPAVVWRLLDELGAAAALVTMGPEGLVAFDRLPVATDAGWARRVRAEHVPALAPFAIDPLGCGDALITASALALSGGSSLLSAAFLGSVAASVQANRIGNQPVSAADLRQAIGRVQAARLAYAAADTIQPVPTRTIPARAPGPDLLRAS